jgi:hypothetical protein
MFPYTPLLVRRIPPPPPHTTAAKSTSSSPTISSPPLSRDYFITYIEFPISLTDDFPTSITFGDSSPHYKKYADW